MRRPNILLLYTDQQRWDTIRAGGHDLMHTPNLDALAERGVLFDRAFCNAPVCMPSRMSMLSGQYPSTLGTTFNGIEMRADVPCLQHALSGAGYHTANLGKLHFLNHASFGRDHRDVHPSFGFDTAVISDEPGCYDDPYIKWVEQHDPAQVDACRCDTPPAWQGEPVQKQPRGELHPHVFEGPAHLTHSAFVADEVCDFLRAHRHEPFFCIGGFYAPHSPINPPERFVRMYERDDMPLPAQGPSDRRADVSDAHWQTIKQYYYALVSHIDEQVGCILGELDRLGLREDTIVVFTSDHGEHLGDHGRTGKGTAHDSAARVPLIVSYPGHCAEGERRDALIEHVDLAPTLLDWAGLQTPPAMQGRSFRPLVEAGRGDYVPRDDVFMEIRRPRDDGFKALRTDRHLYIRQTTGEETLYDMRDDPQQTRDVSGDAGQGEALHELREALLQRWFDVDARWPRRTGPY